MNLMFIYIQIFKIALHTSSMTQSTMSP